MLSKFLLVVNAQSKDLFMLLLKRSEGEENVSNIREGLQLHPFQIVHVGVFATLSTQNVVF